MHLLHSTTPFLHAGIFNLLTKEENDTLYSICEEWTKPHEESINDLSFFVLDKDKEILDKEGILYCRRNSIVMNNVNIQKDGSNLQIYHNIQSNIRERLNSAEFTDVFPVLYNETTNKPLFWGAGLTLSSDYKESPLLPHTDNPEDLVEWAIQNNIHVSSGKYKGVIFITNPKLDYKDYGTRFYTSDNLSSEFLEVPFIGGNACVFKTGPNSWHGTYYKMGLPHKRYTITMEYC